VVFLQLAHDNGWQYNLIEAIDQPWKRDLEGTVGGYWGIYDTELTPKFAFSGDVQPRNDVGIIILAGLLGFALLIGLVFYFQVGDKYLKLGLSAAGTVFGISVWLQTQYLISACRNVLEWATLGGLAFVGWLTVIALVVYLCQSNKRYLVILKICALILVYAAISATALLIVDGRYRDFPISLFALPVLQLSFASVLLGVEVRMKRVFAYVLSVALVMAALYSVYLEAYNISAYYWLMLSGLLALALLPKHQLSTH